MRWRSDKKILPFEPEQNVVPSDPRFQVGKEEGTLLAHEQGVAPHHFEIGADIRRQTDFIDQKQVAMANGRPAFTRNFITLRDIDDVDECVDQLWSKAGGAIVAAS